MRKKLARVIPGAAVHGDGAPPLADDARRIGGRLGRYIGKCHRRAGRLHVPACGGPTLRLRRSLGDALHCSPWYVRRAEQVGATVPLRPTEHGCELFAEVDICRSAAGRVE